MWVFVYDNWDTIIEDCLAAHYQSYHQYDPIEEQVFVYCECLYYHTEHIDIHTNK